MSFRNHDDPSFFPHKKVGILTSSPLLFEGPFHPMEPPPTNRQEANDTVGICGALDATAEVVMAEGDPSQAAELLKDAVKLARNTKMQARILTVAKLDDLG